MINVQIKLILKNEICEEMCYGEKSILIVVLILVILGAVIGKTFSNNQGKLYVETNDLASESEIDVEILYTEVSEDRKEQKELSSTADAYMYYHKTADYNIAIDVYNTGYLNMATKGYKNSSLHEYEVDLSDKDFSAYSNLQWDELKKAEVTDILESFEKFEDDYLEGKIVLE